MLASHDLLVPLEAFFAGGMPGMNPQFGGRNFVRPVKKGMREDPKLMTHCFGRGLVLERLSSHQGAGALLPPNRLL